MQGVALAQELGRKDEVVRAELWRQARCVKPTGTVDLITSSACGGASARGRLKDHAFPTEAVSKPRGVGVCNRWAWR